MSLPFTTVKFCWWQLFLDFIYLHISTLIFKDFFLYIDYGLTRTFFSTLKLSSHNHWVHCLREKVIISFTGAPWIMDLFPLDTSKMYLGLMVFFVFVLIGVCWDSFIYKLTFLFIIFSNIFLPLLIIFSFWNSSYWNDIMPQIIYSLLMYFSNIFFSLFFILHNFYWSVIKVTNSFLLQSIICTGNLRKFIIYIL